MELFPHEAQPGFQLFQAQARRASSFYRESLSALITQLSGRMFNDWVFNDWVLNDRVLSDWVAC